MSCIMTSSINPSSKLVREHFANDGHVFVFFGVFPETDFKIPDLDNVIVLRHPSSSISSGCLSERREDYFHSFLVHPILFYAKRFRPRSGKRPGSFGARTFTATKTFRPAAFSGTRKPWSSAWDRSSWSQTVTSASPRDFNDFHGPGYYGLYKLPVNKDLLESLWRGPRTGRELVVQLNNCF